MDRPPRTVIEAVERLASADLPFLCFMMGPEPRGRIRLEVPHDDVASAVAHFNTHPVTLSDASVVPVDVVGRAGDSWLSQPTRAGAGRTPGPLAPEELVGRNVREAARTATDVGWLVRAFEPQAVLTADSRGNRMNLCYSSDGIVTTAFSG